MQKFLLAPPKLLIHSPDGVKIYLLSGYLFRPNVCPYRDVELVPQRTPCVRAYTRMVKVWKPNCGYANNWCVGYERRYAISFELNISLIRRGC